MTVTLTPTQRRLLESDRTREALGPAVADDVTAALRAAGHPDAETISVDLMPWRDALSAALREVGPDSEDATVMEAADNLVKQLSV